MPVRILLSTTVNAWLCFRVAYTYTIDEVQWDETRTKVLRQASGQWELTLLPHVVCE